MITIHPSMLSVNLALRACRSALRDKIFPHPLVVRFALESSKFLNWHYTGYFASARRALNQKTEVDKTQKKCHKFGTKLFLILNGRIFLRFSKKRMISIKRKKNTTSGTNFLKTRTWGNLEKFLPPPSTWHQILKPIRMCDNF